VSNLCLIGTVSLSLFAVAARAQDKPAEPPPAGGSAPAGAAETGAPRQKWVVACEADIKKLCLEPAKAGDPRPCLAEHEGHLSQACKDSFIKQYEILQLCKGDIDKLCGGATEGRTLAKCFNDKREELSPKCRTALTKGSRAHAKSEAKPEPAGASRKKKAPSKTVE
jgi:hypothetical protein